MIQSFVEQGVMESDWDALEQALRGCEPVTNAECEYLKKAFVATERMWAENVSKRCHEN